MKKRVSTKVIIKFVNETSAQGYSALHYASFRGNLENIQTLIENGADINAINLRGLNVLHMAAQGNQPLSLVYFKEKYRLDIHSVDMLGTTPLHWACYTGNENAVQFILHWKEVNVNIKNSDGYTALHLAVISNNTKVIKKLLQKADKSVQDNQGRTALDIAKMNSKPCIIDLLQESKKCQMCFFRTPVEQSERSSLNIVFFFLVHVVFEPMVFFGLLPLIGNYFISILYIVFFFIVMAEYIALMKSNPCVMRNEKACEILTLIEEKINIDDYCPSCVVAKTMTSKHCILCNVCVDGFDHHCYWVDNCIGKGNFSLFFMFLVMMEINLFIKGTVAIMSFRSGYKSTGNFPPRISIFPFLYYPLTTLVLGIALLTICIIFAIPIFFLIMLHLRNFYYKEKIHNTLKISSDNMEQSYFSADSKESVLRDKEMPLINIRNPSVDPQVPRETLQKKSLDCVDKIEIHINNNY